MLHYARTAARKVVPQFLRRAVGHAFLNPATRYAAVWKIHEKAVEIVSRATVRSDSSAAAYRQNGFSQGVLPEPVVAEFQRSLQSARLVEWRSDDWTPGFVRDAALGAIESSYNAGHKHFELGPAQLKAVEALLEALEAPIKQCMGVPWRVVHSRCRQTSSSAQQQGPMSWHTDSFPTAFHKLLIYLTPAGPETGATELRLPSGGTHMVEGTPGTWLLFKNSVVVHRGIVPKRGDRLLLELTLAPAWRFSKSPVYAGLNTQYPKYPWTVRNERSDV